MGILMQGFINYIVLGIFLIVISGNDYPIPTPYVLFGAGVVFASIGVLSFLGRFSHLIFRLARHLHRYFDIPLVFVTYATAFHLIPQAGSFLLFVLILIMILGVLICISWIKDIVASARSYYEFGQLLHRSVPIWILFILAEIWLDDIYSQLFPFSSIVFGAITIWCLASGYIFKEMD